MQPETLVSAVVLAMVNVLAFQGLPRIWRHETAIFDRPPTSWAWGQRGWAAVVRCLPLSCFALTALWLTVLLGMLVPEERWAGLHRPWWFTVPMFGTFGVIALAYASIALFNRPKALVAPHLRAQRGLFG